MTLKCDDWSATRMNLYQKISKDNRAKYGTEFEKVLKIIIL